MSQISEISIVPIIPKDGLVGFASFIFSDSIYMGSIAIFTRPQGGYRLIYPTKRVGIKEFSLFYPINKITAQAIEEEIINKFEEVTKDNDRHSSFSF